MILQHIQTSKICLKYYKYQQQPNLKKGRRAGRKTKRATYTETAGVWEEAAGGAWESGQGSGSHYQRSQDSLDGLKHPALPLPWCPLTISASALASQQQSLKDLPNLL